MHAYINIYMYIYECYFLLIVFMDKLKSRKTCAGIFGKMFIFVIY